MLFFYSGRTASSTVLVNGVLLKLKCKLPKFLQLYAFKKRNKGKELCVAARMQTAGIFPTLFR